MVLKIIILYIILQ